MKVISFARLEQELVEIEVEVSLSPGLPQIQIIGLPDPNVRESALRVRSAIREQGFSFPQAQQILVQLRPSHVRKKSQGLDLAIALAILWETGQVALPSEVCPAVYGELTLKGEVIAPDDLDEISSRNFDRVITGSGSRAASFPVARLQELKSIVDGQLVIEEGQLVSWTRPRSSIKTLAESAARVAMVVAAGEHSLLTFGSAGSGKSTLAEFIPTLLEEPKLEEFEQARKFARRVGQGLSWRPVMHPHHSITPLAMIGGGGNLWAGEITRAHGGVLIMDELLEFHSEIQEMLREPVETGMISLVRGGKSTTYPARLLLIATTNLCSCGGFIPQKANSRCKCTQKEIRKTLTRLTGPFVDRFAVLASSNRWMNESDISCSDVASRVASAIEFRKSMRKQGAPNSRLMSEAIEEELGSAERSQLKSYEVRSRRRKTSILRVARTVADLRSSEVIKEQDIYEAFQLALREHRHLETALIS